MNKCILSINQYSRNKNGGGGVNSVAYTHTRQEANQQTVRGVWATAPGDDP